METAADADLAFFGFTFTYDQNVGYLVELGIANFRSEFFGVEVTGGADAVGLELTDQALGVVGYLVGDWQDADLLWCEPSREVAAEVFDEQSAEAFHGAEGSAVYHDGTVRLVVGSGIVDVETDG